jgi:predicted GTPase
MASGSSLRIGSNLGSCTEEVQFADEFILDRRPVLLIDTPGFDDTNKSDTEILKLIAAFLATA